MPSDGNHSQRYRVECVFGSFRRNIRLSGFRFNCCYEGCDYFCYRHEEFAQHCELFHFCPNCGEQVANRNEHACDSPIQRGGHFAPIDVNTQQFQEVERAHLGTLVKYSYEFTDPFETVADGFDHIHDDWEHLLRVYLQSYGGVIVLCSMNFRLISILDNSIVYKRLHTPWLRITHENFIDENMLFAVQYIINSLSLYNEGSSSFMLDWIEDVEVTIGEFAPIRVGQFIELPIFLAQRRGFLNIKTTRKNQNCFELSVIAGVHYQKVVLPDYPKLKLAQMSKAQKQRLKRRQENPRSWLAVQHYLRSKEKIDFSGLCFPIKLEQIADFEIRNKIGITIFVPDSKTKLKCIRLCEETYDKTVDLLLLKSVEPQAEAVYLNSLDRNSENVETIYHFVLITDLPAVMGRTGCSRRDICRLCLKRCITTMKKHLSQCRVLFEAKYTFPEQKSFKFSKLHMLMEPQFRGFFDFECYSKPVTDQSSSTSKTRKITDFEVCAFGLVVLGPQNVIRYQKFYVGANALQFFLELIINVGRQIKLHIQTNHSPLKPTKDDYKRLSLAVTCNLCGNFFNFKNRRRVMHHDHLISTDILIICKACNHRIQNSRALHLLCHNGSGFDFAFILRALRHDHLKSLKAIPKNQNKFIGFVFENSLKILDSLNFLSYSLEQLSNRLRGDGSALAMEQFKILKEGMNNHPSWQLLTQKQFFPYSYLSGPEVLNDPELPPIDQFYNNLTDECLSIEDYVHAQTVYKKFNCQRFQDYLELYLKTDVFLLACVFTNFAEKAFATYGLSLYHNFSLASYSYDVSMYISKANFDYLSDLKQVEMMMTSLRGGPSTVCTKVLTSNNEEVGNFNGVEDERSHIGYFDANSLYLHMLGGKLPHSEYEWLSRAELLKIDFENLSDKHRYGYIITCNLRYPIELHQKHKWFPMACEHRHILDTELSPIQSALYDLYRGRISDPFKFKRLLQTCHDKEEYTVYSRALQYYLKSGLVLTNITKGFRFFEKAWLYNFQQMNVVLRQNATDEIMNLLIKLTGNAMIGFTILNAKDFVDIEVCLSRTRALNLLSKHNFKGCYQINTDLSVFMMSRSTAYMDKCSGVAYVVLEMGKIHMLRQYYEIINVLFEDRLTVGMQENDSFIFKCLDKDRNYYNILKANSDKFDFSGLDKTHFLYDITNKGKPGMLKLVLANVVEYIGLKPKSYSLLLFCPECKNTYQAKNCTTCDKMKSSIMKAKGVPRTVLRKMNHEFYRKVLVDKELKRVDANLIKSIKQRVGIYQVNRLGYHIFDMNRYYISSIDTLPYGHCDIPTIIQALDDRPQAEEMSHT